MPKFKMLRIIAAILLIFLLLPLSGCYDADEVTDIAYVMFIGIDKGISDKWRVTFQIPSASSGSDDSQSGGNGGGQGGQKSMLKSVTLDAPSFIGAIELADILIPRKLNFMHTQFLVFSEEMAESGLIGEFIAPIIRHREIRFDVNLLISRGKAENFVKAYDPYIGTTIARSVNNFIGKSGETGFFNNLTLYDIYDCIKSTYHQPIAVLGAVNTGENFIEEGEEFGTGFNITGDYYAGDVPRKEGAKVEFLGTAILNGDRMVGKLTGFENRMLSITKGIFEKGVFTIQDPKMPELIIPIRTKLMRKNKTTVKFEGDKPIINVKIQMEGDILAIQSKINYEDPKLQPLLEKTFEEYIRKGIQRTIEKTQKLNCDVFKFGHTAVRQFKTIQEWEAYDWNNHYKDAEISTEVSFKIRRTGKLIKSAPIISSENKE